MLVYTLVYSRFFIGGAVKYAVKFLGPHPTCEAAPDNVYPEIDRLSGNRCTGGKRV